MGKKMLWLGIPLLALGVGCGDDEVSAFEQAALDVEEASAALRGEQGETFDAIAGSDAGVFEGRPRRGHHHHGGHRGHGGGHGLLLWHADLQALDACREQRQACLASGDDACRAEVRDCVQAVLEDAFAAMCEEAGAMCEAADAPGRPCGRIAHHCGGAPDAGGAAADAGMAEAKAAAAGDETGDGRRPASP